MLEIKPQALINSKMNWSKGEVMSFASEIKEIICESTDEKWCCKRSELVAMLCFGATLKNNVLKIKLESSAVFERMLALLDEVANVGRQKITLPAKEGGRYILSIDKAEEIERLSLDLGLKADGDNISFLDEGDIFESNCCEKSFIKGAYLISGSLSDPKKNYHLEFVCKQPRSADILFELLQKSKINAKLTVRKNTFVVYIKEFEAIADFLGIVGANSKMMEIYNLKIERELRNEVNRVVNCDSANIKKITGAAKNQIEAINKISELYGLDKLPETLVEIARLRCENPEASLIELGRMSSPPIGKSGVNHRLERIVEFAKKL